MGERQADRQTDRQRQEEKDATAASGSYDCVVHSHGEEEEEEDRPSRQNILVFFCKGALPSLYMQGRPTGVGRTGSALSGLCVTVLPSNTS